MSPTSFVVRSTTLLSSLAITALAIAIIYKTGNAFLRLTTDFPPGSYVWKGVDEANEFLEPWDDEVRDGKALVARIYYAWSTEYMTWVAAGASIVAGLLGVAIEAAMAVGKQRRSGNGSAISTAVGVTAIGFATIAFVASMFAALWAYYQHYEFGRGCAWNLSEDVQSVYTCTSELATCDMWQFFSNRRDLGARGGICSKMVSVSLYVGTDWGS